MPLLAPKTGKEFSPAAVGLQQGVIAKIVDLGVKQEGVRRRGQRRPRDPVHLAGRREGRKRRAQESLRNLHLLQPREGQAAQADDQPVR